MAKTGVALSGFVVVCLLVGCNSPAQASTYIATPSDYLQHLPKLRPGDTLMLKPGIYLNGLPIHGLMGLPNRYIVIKGVHRNPSARFIARKNANTVSIADSAYIEISNLEIDGRDLAVHGVVAEGWAKFAHDIILDRLFIHSHGADQQINGISTKCPAWNWIIRRNTIVGAGTGMYLGQSDGTAPFVAGVIEHNSVVDSAGYNLQVKHQRERRRLDGMPQRRAITIIRHNVFSKANGSAAGEAARPNVLVGHWPLAGAGSDDIYAIY
jgi:hypothetical protein